MSVQLSRDEAWNLLSEWVQSESLRRHCLAVERRCAPTRDAAAPSEELWGVVGLLHDMDYERHPDLDTGHPRIALAELEARDVDPVVVRAIASHADFLASRATRTSRRRSTPSTSSAASSWPAPMCAPRASTA
jgi:putative nucleotidyltransferase with HDIG domain